MTVSFEEILLASGLLLTVLSIVMNGYIAKRKEKRKASLELEIDKIEKELSEGRDLQASSELKANIADLFLLGIKKDKSDKNVYEHMHNVKRNMIASLNDKYMAFHYATPPVTYINDWQAKIDKILIGQAGTEEYVKEGNRLMKEYVDKEHKLSVQRHDYIKNKIALEFSIEKIRYWAITIQSVGLIFITSKDFWK